MKVKIMNFRVPVTSKEELQTLVEKKYALKSSEIREFKILRSAIDARKKKSVFYDYQFYVHLVSQKSSLLRDKDVALYQEPADLQYPLWSGKDAPVVVGFGPAGMFAALYLARCKANPIVVERGGSIEQRKKDVENFLIHKQLNENSNIQFGEGGAGTFSDGKLNTNINSELNRFVLQEFYLHGAAQEVTYSSAPHVGTDYLECVVKNIRKEIISLGGTFYFNTTFLDFEKQGDRTTVFCTHSLSFTTRHLLLCLGHSARDTIATLFEKGLAMEPKSFSMGVRIEHLQAAVNQKQYGLFAQYLPPASYKGVVHLERRSVYTFCMCPGGTVIASASEKNSIVSNGMSEKSRDKTNANSALLVGVNPADFYRESPLDGLKYQEKYERLAFNVAKDYRAPANLVGEFLKGSVAKQHRSVVPSYPHGVCFCNLTACLPDFVVDSLREALPKFDEKMKGFCNPDAVLTGVETRSSSPIRILRDQNRQANIGGIYPVGEGAGYAGGIVSAAIDGLKTAIEIVRNLSGQKESETKDKE